MAPLYRTLRATAIGWLLAATVVALPRPAAAHSFGAIDADYTVTADAVDAVLHLTTHDLHHLIDLDTDAAGRLSPATIAANRDRFASTITAALSLASEPGGAVCAATLTDFAVVGFDRVDARLRYRCPQPVTALTLRSGLFRGSAYDYQLHAHVRFASGEVEVELDPQHNRATVTPPAADRHWLLPSLGATVVLGLLGAALVWWRGRSRR